MNNAVRMDGQTGMATHLPGNEPPIKELLRQKAARGGDIPLGDINVRTALPAAVINFVHMWPKWIAFSFVHVITTIATIVASFSRFNRYCTIDPDKPLRCAHPGLLTALVIFVIVGVAFYMTVAAVWASTKQHASRWRLTFIVSLPLATLVVAACVATAVAANHVIGFVQTSNNSALVSFPVAAAIAVVITLATLPFSLIPALVADHRPARISLKVARRSPLSLLGFGLITLTAFVLALAASVGAKFLLPGFVFVLPLVAQLWNEAFAQVIAPAEDARRRREWIEANEI